jgi:membrane fusion protein
MSLFRPEVIQARSKTGLGEVIITQPRVFGYLTVGGLMLLSCLLVFIAFGQISRKETVSGYLAPIDGIASIYAVRGGVVSELFVQPGIHVQSGDRLVHLDTDMGDANGGREIASQISQIETRISELRLQLEINARQHQAERARLEDQIGSSRLLLNQLNDRLQLAAESEEIALEQLTRWQSLGERGLATNAAVDLRRQDYLGARASRIDIARQITEQEAAISQALHALEILPATEELEQSRLRSSLLTLQQSQSELSRSAGYTLTAPVTGTVSFVQANLGDRPSANRPLMAILPQNRSLYAHLLVPTRAAGFVEPGQTVNLRIDAYPYQRFGALPARIDRISSSVITPDELSAPVSGSEPVYQVVAGLSGQTIQAYGLERKLEAGMLLQADIVVDQRPIWRWALDPVLAMRGAGQ